MKIYDLEPIIESSTDTHIIARELPRLDNAECWYDGKFSEIPLGMAVFEIESITVEMDYLNIVINV